MRQRRMPRFSDTIIPGANGTAMPTRWLPAKARRGGRTTAGSAAHSAAFSDFGIRPQRIAAPLQAAMTSSQARGGFGAAVRKVMQWPGECQGSDWGNDQGKACGRDQAAMWSRTAWMI